MDAVFAPSEQQNRQMKNPSRKNTHNSISRSSTENLAPLLNNNSKYGSGGLFYGPPPTLSFSYPPPASFNPPLLPLPISKPHYSLPLPSRTQSLSRPPVRKTNRSSTTRDHSLTPKKSKLPNKREEPKKGSLVVASTTGTVPFGPDPSDLPKHVPNGILTTFSVNDLDKFSGSVFTLSPPPSSLPLPKFFLRPKLSCNAEAAGIDAGATDNLRRILRLR